MSYPSTYPPQQTLPPHHARPDGRAPEPSSSGPRASNRTEPTAVAALIMGVLGFVVPLVGILAILFGGIGLDRTRRRGTRGRGMAGTGVAFGSIQVVFTAIVVVAGILFWNAYGDQVNDALDEASEFTQQDLSLPGLLLGGVTGDYSLGDLQDLAGAAQNMDELKGLAGECQGGDTAACDDLLSQVPDDMVPDSVRDQLLNGG